MARLESVITVSASVRIVRSRLRFRPLLTASDPPLNSSVIDSSMSSTRMPTRAFRLSKSLRLSWRAFTLASIRPPSIWANALASSPSGYSTSRLVFVREVDRDPGRALGHLLRRPGVADDGRQVALELELALHHPLGRVELLAHHLLPARVGRRHHEVALLRLIGRNHLDVPGLAVEEVQENPVAVGDVLIGLGLDDQAHGPLPALAGLLVDLALVDLFLERLRELRAEGPNLRRCHGCTSLGPKGSSSRVSAWLSGGHDARRARESGRGRTSQDPVASCGGSCAASARRPDEAVRPAGSCGSR